MAKAKDSFHESFASYDEVKQGSNRSFGYFFGGIFLLYACFPFFKGHPVRIWALILGLAFLVVTIFFPHALKPLNYAWFRFSMLLSKIMNPIVMGILFFVIITPLGILMRLSGGDPLKLKWKKDVKSYWLPRTPPGPAPEKMANPY